MHRWTATRSLILRPGKLARHGLLVLVALVTTSPALAGGKVVRLVVDGPLTEAPMPDAELLALFGQEPPRSLRGLVETIERAARDKDVKGMALIIETPAMNLAQAEELVRALRAFRAVGKPVHCYLDYAGNLSYLLATAADHITLAEYSTLDIAGLRAELSFYKGMLDKVGVQADMLHCGAYKSALEPFTRTEPSKEAAENVNWLLDGLYTRWIDLMAENRKLDAQAMRAAVDAAPVDAAPALEKKLVDAVGSFASFREHLRKEFGAEADVVKDYGKSDKFKLDMSNPFAFFEMFNQALEASTAPKKAGIGLIYAEGPIMTGKNQAGFMGGASVGSTTLRAALEKAARDENIKAVVLRVDSPGGSALASDIMWKAATKLAASKPLIVSMGGVAGSGGYYIALPGEVIFAEETTITGSIGVVGGKMVWKKLFEDHLGITTTEFTRGAHAGLMSPNEPWTAAERETVQTWMNTIYDQFKQRVKTSRGERLKGELDDLAGGRVFTGRQALERGLVDKLGGISDAIRYAANRAGLSAYDVYVLPEPKDFGAVLAELMGEESEDEYEIPGAASTRLPLRSAAESPAGALARLLTRSGDASSAALLGTVAPQELQRAMRGLFRAALLQREPVGMFMPMELSIR